MTAEELRIARKAAGLTMAAACREAGVPYTTWLSWETTGPNGRRPNPLAFAWLKLFSQNKNN